MGRNNNEDVVHHMYAGVSSLLWHDIEQPINSII